MYLKSRDERSQHLLLLCAVPQHLCAGQRTTAGFCPSTVFFPGIRTHVVGLGDSAFPVNHFKYVNIKE